MALIDLKFADERQTQEHNCAICRKNPKTAEQRKCDLPGFDMLEKKPRPVGPGSLRYPFCPGKATWYPIIQETFEDCLVAYTTGILPSEGSLQDQNHIFADVFPTFVDRYKERAYQRVWSDVITFVKPILESFGKKS